MGDGAAASDNNPLAFLQNFRFPFPNFQKKKKEAEKVVGEVVRVIEEEEVEKSPGLIRFTRRKEIESPGSTQLKVEVEEDQTGKTSNPLVLWQVYALGGFLILRWVWGRWQERKARKGSDDQNPDPQDPPADDVGSS
ncbi:hypothetical protein MLD38_009839 [Melastoma candidum]|uniref:Uncharacterized protein n=1 Tax=Melastoma candidum TaxID=119954 RepID=A0ACB9S0S4_9MYRT|nr:hypothetical protein MLD38_009839 [Melastoma candidum]